MFIVCQHCHRVLVEGKWLAGVPPIKQVKYTVCPDCQKKPPQEPGEPGKGMVYQEYVRKQNREKK